MPEIVGNGCSRRALKSALRSYETGQKGRDWTLRTTTRNCRRHTDGQALHTTTRLRRGKGGGVEQARVVGGFHGNLFLYVQELAPFQELPEGLPAFRRACLSTPLYKNNPFSGRIDCTKVNAKIL
jgi:hypothetical protein